MLKVMTEFVWQGEEPLDQADARALLGAQLGFICGRMEHVNTTQYQQFQPMHSMVSTHGLVNMHLETSEDGKSFNY